MINRKPSLLRDLKTGVVLFRRALTFRAGVFKTRRFSLVDAILVSGIILVPLTALFGSAMAYAWYTDQWDKVVQLFQGYLVLCIGIIWIADGAFSNTLGGSGSETD